MELASVRILEDRNIPFRLIELKDTAVSVQDVVKFSKGDIKTDEICKTMILKDKQGEKYAIFLLGSKKVDLSKAKEAIGEKVSIASIDEVNEVAGVQPGAVCPLLLDITIFVDEQVFEKEKINFGSGNHLFGIEISPKYLSKIIQFKTGDFSQL